MVKIFTRDPDLLDNDARLPQPDRIKNFSRNVGNGIIRAAVDPRHQPRTFLRLAGHRALFGQHDGVDALREIIVSRDDIAEGWSRPSHAQLPMARSNGAMICYGRRHDAHTTRAPDCLSGPVRTRLTPAARRYCPRQAQRRHAGAWSRYFYYCASQTSL